MFFFNFVGISVHQMCTTFKSEIIQGSAVVDGNLCRRKVFTSEIIHFRQFAVTAAIKMIPNNLKNIIV